MGDGHKFRDLLGRGVVLFDGAMGTMLYSRGVYINRCYDELNLSSPELVGGVHAEYAAAGADVVETNTFGANRVKLAPHGLAERLADINAAGVRLAREAAGAKALVAGAIGPLGIKIEPLGPTSLDEARALFREQAAVLVASGVDLLVLETFGDLAELEQAVLGAREAGPGLPLVAQVTVGDNGYTLYGTAPDRCAAALEALGVDVVGVNCSVGPEPTLAAIERMAAGTRLPLSAQPNAGPPRAVEGRNIYLSSPEYFAEYAKRFIAAGVSVLGGCCGTTPAHIKAMRNAIRALRPRSLHLSAGPSPVGDFPGSSGRPAPSGASPDGVPADQQRQSPPLSCAPIEQRSKFGAKLKAGEFAVSVEFTPPRGPDPRRTLEGVAAIGPHVDAVNIPDGPRASARMSPLALGVLIQQQLQVEVILHYTCRDRNLLGIQSDLLGAAALGIRNLLLVTGDPPKLGNYPDATAVFDVDSIGLTHIVAWLNRGLDVARNPIGAATAFVFGVGVNPGALDLELEIRRFEYKVEAGAEYAITQPVFDPALLERFIERTRHCRVPLLAGVWPLTSLRNAQFMRNEVPGAFVPDALMARLEAAEAAGRAADEGIAIAVETLQRVRPLVQGLQLAVPLGRYRRVLGLLQEAGLARAPRGEGGR
ncbi:MAG: bifunctional homocysteine S-methyltransferase/methylenetetrahydrofolate reductase [Deltaproteobacteria bacterium]|nr:bifunctional homocysteine S-methyltransferase/methylenetetrahydrofolate reductase [Deltaproteobacteria bacterium]